MTAIQETAGEVPDKDQEAGADTRNHLRRPDPIVILPPDRGVPPGWHPQPFNGAVYYIIPLR